MTNSTPPRARMTHLTRRWIGTRRARCVALLRTYPARTAQLGRVRPRAHVAVDLII
jgi:hypothetical protein